MRSMAVRLAVVLILSTNCVGRAEKFANGGFESEIDASNPEAMWGAHGSMWGGTLVIAPGTNGPIARAGSGKRCLQIDPSPSAWDGAWQQLPWAAGRPFVITGSYLIRGGNLPPGCVTALKAEFYDKNDEKLGEIAGEDIQNDTKGKWKKIMLKGVTPRGTAFLRAVVVAGDNPDGATITDRIFWDDIELK